MLTILKCPKCGAPALCSPSLSEAANVRCSKCGFTDYLKSFRNEDKGTPKGGTPPLGIAFLQEMAKIAQSIDALHLQGGVDGYVKRQCMAFDLSPWTLIEVINAYISQAQGGGHAPNPLRFVTLQPGEYRVDDLLQTLRAEMQRMRQRAAVAPTAQSSDASEWIDRYNKLQTDLQKKESAYANLLAAYRQAKATLEENGLE